LGHIILFFIGGDLLFVWGSLMAPP
jgi:hypothetical protein